MIFAILYENTQKYNIKSYDINLLGSSSEAMMEVVVVGLEAVGVASSLHLLSAFPTHDLQ